jgi:hypothetical protein
MSYTPQNLAELDVLMLFESPSGLEGIKIHKNADAAVIAAAKTKAVLSPRSMAVT